MDKTKLIKIFCFLFLFVQFGCSGDPRLSVQNTFNSRLFYEITTAGEASAYLSGQMNGKVKQTLTLRTGKSLLIFVNPDTTYGENNFITLDSLVAEEGKKYLLEINPQYVSGHLHTNPKPASGPGWIPISTQNPLR